MIKPLSIYIHLPFCEQRCGYCDFVSCCDVALIDQYLDQLLAEIKAFDFSSYIVKTIYVGGGTPSLLTPSQVRKLFAALPKCRGEITLEANPNSLTAAKLAAYRAVGINRLSIGVQSFNDRTLRDLGRLHDVKQAVTAIKLAKQYFENISIDLIKDIPGHALLLPPASVLDMVKHISIYSLTKDDQPVMETDEDVLLPLAFRHYEVSNYARPGYESQHNLVYWTGGEYIGFGSGAHSLLNNTRFCNSNNIIGYHRNPATPRTAEMVRHEKIMLGLRLSTGFDRSLLIDKDSEVAMLQEHGLIRLVGEKIVATKRGLKILNQIWLRLV